MYLKLNNLKIFTYQLVIFTILTALLSSCYTLSLHQTGKTLGKGKSSVQLMTGTLGLPFQGDSTLTGTSVGIDLPKIQFFHGFTEKIDLGGTFGLNKTGLAIKYQWIGNDKSKFAIANGLYVFSGMKDILSFEDKEGLSGVELPLFISYHPFEKLSIYGSPVLSYLAVEGRNTFFDEPFFNTGFYKGLIAGIQFEVNTTINHLKLIPSIEATMSAPLYKTNKQMSLSVGIAVAF